MLSFLQVVHHYEQTAIYSYLVDDLMDYNNLMIPSPKCAGTGAAATFFCYSKGCTLPAFCCGWDCLKKHRHRGTMTMQWDEVSKDFAPFFDELPPFLMEDVRKVEKDLKILQDKLIQIFTHYKINLLKAWFSIKSKPVAKVTQLIKFNKSQQITGNNMCQCLKQINNEFSTGEHRIQRRITFENLINRYPFQNVFAGIDRFYEEESERIRLNADKLVFNYKRTIESLRSALEMYTQSISYNDKNSKSYFGRGQCFLECQNNLKALKDFETAINLDNHNADFFAYRALTYLALDRVDEGIKDCELALKVKQDHPWALSLKGFLRVIRGQRKSGMIDICENIERNRFQSMTHFMKAMAWAILENWDEAISDVTTAITCQKQLKFFAFRGSCYFKKRKFKEALNDYSTAIEMDPTFPPNYQDRAQVYRALGQTQHAIADEMKFKDPQSLVLYI